MTDTSRSTAAITKIIQIEKPKSAIAAFLLAFIFGPLGLLYATVTGGLVMIVISLVAMPLTGFLAGIVIWPVCWIWAIVAAAASKSSARKAQAELDAATRTRDDTTTAGTTQVSRGEADQKGDKN